MFGDHDFTNHGLLPLFPRGKSMTKTVSKVGGCPWEPHLPITPLRNTATNLSGDPKLIAMTFGRSENCHVKIENTLERKSPFIPDMEWYCLKEPLPSSDIQTGGPG